MFTQPYKYVEFENVNDGWSIFVRDCPLGTRWHQPIQNCNDDDTTTQKPNNHAKNTRMQGTNYRK